MATVTATRTIAASPDAVRSLIRTDVPAFIRASGFDAVTVEGETYTVSRTIGVATFELTLTRIESEHVLEFEQTEGIFEDMWTRYRVQSAPEGAELVATTEFTLGGVLGPVLDNSLIKTQRTGEFTDQFDYVERELT
ncbi:SRPBCC family protein [Halodesulfurarchaeum sp. HSR-GB]|uniref:SRPBCC family protein n=1 Tax=Halodesulfurarchaeum sp. HSR-GB TaxID=3074077 RepID=UPI002856B66B|nr:SRPBCC family protein [Halodesulfurarchaeum sp. HSR-GB]MDR5656448.1 SRPBCC family protein [Halodesulfurarchaeum sp. HSR-GB]